MNDRYIAQDNSESKEGEGVMVEWGSMSHKVVSLRFILHCETSKVWEYSGFFKLCT